MVHADAVGVEGRLVRVGLGLAQADATRLR
jgi:hypothetical protein